MFIKEIPGKRHPKFRIIRLSDSTSMLLACSIDFLFFMISLLNY